MSSDQPFLPKRPYFYDAPPIDPVTGKQREAPHTAEHIAAIGGLFDNFMILLRRSPRTLVVPWLITALFDLAFVVASIVLAWVWSNAGDITGTGDWLAMFVMRLVTALQFVVVYTMRIALYGPMRRVLFEGEAAYPGGWQEMFASISSRLLPVFVINVAVGAVVAVGLMLCAVPGVVALFFLAFAPYLVAARNRSVGSAFTESFKLAADHWAVLLTAIVVVIGVAILLGGVTMGGMLVFGEIMGRGAIVVGYLGMWIVNTVIGFFGWIYWGSLYSTVDRTAGLVG